MASFAQGKVAPDRLQQFLDLHKGQLRALGVPEALYETLYVKLSTQCFDSFERFGIEQDEELQRQCVVTDENGVRAVSDIFLIDHALTIPDSDISQLRLQISSYPQLTERIGAMLGIDTAEHSDTENCTDRILQRFWKFACCYHLSGINSSSNWFIMDELGSAITHSGEPNVNCVPFMFIQAPMTDNSPPQLIPFSVMWPVKDMDHGDYVERDFCSWVSTPIERIAHLVDWIDDVDADLTEQLKKGAVYHNEELAAITTKGGISGNIFDARKLDSCNVDFISSRQAPLPPIPGSEWKVYTADDDPLRLHDSSGGLSHPKFLIVENRDDANILWLSEPMKSEETAEFWQHGTANDSINPRFVNQFPYEGVFCLKDNLVREVSRCLGMPKWWVSSYDLETQLPIFAGEYMNRQLQQLQESSSKSKEYNVWIAKPNNGARSAGHVVSNSLIRIIRSLEVSKSRIAQKYIERPLLFRKQFKFDMRFIVMVRSFELGKEEIYVYNDFWCRVANKAHNIDTVDEKINQRLLDDHESYLTASHLLPGVEQREKMPSCDAVIADLKESFPLLNWDKINSEIYHLLRELFLGLSSGQGGKMHAPAARALYGVDIMLDSVTNADGEVYDAQPKLLEVSFTPSNNAVSEHFAKNYPTYVNDVFSCLFLGEQVNVTRLL